MVKDNASNAQIRPLAWELIGWQTYELRVIFIFVNPTRYAETENVKGFTANDQGEGKILKKNEGPKTTHICSSSSSPSQYFLPHNKKMKPMPSKWIIYVTNRNNKHCILGWHLEDTQNDKPQPLILTSYIALYMSKLHPVSFLNVCELHLWGKNYLCLALKTEIESKKTIPIIIKTIFIYFKNYLADILKKKPFWFPWKQVLPHF